MTKAVAEVFGEMVEHYRRVAVPSKDERAARPPAKRDRPGITQDELAARTAAIGLPMGRVAIANIEAAGRPESENKNRSRGRNATLYDVLTLAYALDVPPALLFVPLGRDEEVTLGNLTFHPHLFHEWVAGEQPPAPTPDSEFGGLSHRSEPWLRNATPVRMFSQLRSIMDDAATAANWLSSVSEAMEMWPQNEHDVDGAQRSLDRRLRALDRHLEAMRGIGLSTPELSGEWTARMMQLRVMPEDDS